MRGTLVCAVTERDESADALALSAELSERLGLRLVLAHVVNGIGGFGNEDGVDSVSMRATARAQSGGWRASPTSTASPSGQSEESPSASRPRCSVRLQPRRPPT